MVEYRDKYSPNFDPNNPEKETGIYHEWEEYNGSYYGPNAICKKCEELNWGWNLWKEDFLPTCKGKPRKKIEASIVTSTLLFIKEDKK